MSSYQITVFEHHLPVYTAVLDGVVELGRQYEQEPTAYSHRWDASTKRWRMVIANLNELQLSRKHILAEPLSGGWLRLKNRSTTLTVLVENGPEVPPGGAQDLQLPLVLLLGQKTVRFETPEEEDGPLEYLPEATLAPPVDDESVTSRIAALAPPVEVMAVEGLVRWMRVTMDVLHSAASSTEFFARAARAVVELVGLDLGRVLLLEAGTWKVQTVQRRKHAPVEADAAPSRRVLERVQHEKRTFWQVPATTREETSLAGVSAVVAAPILDRKGEVIGALYGDRRQLRGSAQPVTRLEAMLVELLAAGAAAGLARQEMEQAALRARVQFEQFFTPELSRELEAHPDLLRGRDQEVTLLFCDIRGFSGISVALGPARTVEWMNDVMGVLSECVLAEEGVLVDYIGDELVAMWGAPKDQADQAPRACRAALAILQRLPALQDRWLAATQEPMDLGIGINSGPACVGNMGSQYKFKYGPLGNTVNVASRVQGVTKYLKTRLLITEATQHQLGPDFATRRLLQARLVNIDRPVSVYELVEPAPPRWAELKQDYQQALELFERKEFLQACRVLGNLLPAHEGDGPSLLLMSRVLHFMQDKQADFDPVWELPGK
jgi:adenylate cyclase